MADDPASQLSLPVELITFVTDEISPSDLLNLRLACRDTAAKTHDVFLRVHFEDKCFMGSHKPSMDTLLRISETKEFAQSIKRLWFFSSRLTILKNQQSTEIAIRKQLTAQPSGMARRSQTNLYKPPYEALKGQEKAFVGESRIQLLTQTFENFQKAGSAPDIKCAGAELTYATTPNGGRRIRTLYDLLDKLKPWVYQTLNGLFGHPRHSTLERPWSMSGQNHSESQHRWYDHAHIYEAIVDSRFATRTLELGDCNVPLSLREFNYKEGTFNLPSLRSLKLAVCVPRGKDMDWDTAFAHTGLRALARFLACAQKLQHLALSMLPVLESFELVYAWNVEFDTLLSFLRDRKDTLTTVKLSDVRIIRAWHTQAYVEQAISDVLGVADKPGFELLLDRVGAGPGPR